MQTAILNATKIITPTVIPNIIPPAVPRRIIYGGLVWPEKGNPAYFCTIGEHLPDKTATFDTPPATYQIYQEGEAKTIYGLFELLKDVPRQYCREIFTLMDMPFHGYIRDFNRLKREYGLNLSLRKTKSPNFEAAILKIRDIITAKGLIFPEKSLIRTQLSMFAKEYLTDAVNFYAVRALAMVIGAFDRPKNDGGAETVPKLRAWW